jgi:hypothetical protein
VLTVSEQAQKALHKLVALGQRALPQAPQQALH